VCRRLLRKLLRDLARRARSLRRELERSIRREVAVLRARGPFELDPELGRQSFERPSGQRALVSRERRSRVYRRSVEDEGQQRQLNIHIDPDVMAGVYSNFANISFSDYEFTLTFARIDHEVEEGDVPGVVVARVNMSTRFMRELLDAMQDSWSKWSSREGIRNLPETPENDS
jgi:hypothetical protein